MSHALRCDRCGRLFDPMGIFGRVLSFRNPSLHTPEDYRHPGCVTRQNFRTDIPPDGTLDFCPTCTDEFIAFMDGAKHILQRKNSADKTIAELIRKNSNPDNEKDGV